MIIDPESRYLERDWGRLGYHVLDGGAAGHVVWLNELNQNVDLSWADPELASAISSLARDQLTSVIWQERGVGLSDPVSRPATVEEQVDDLIAVLDHEDIERAVIVSCLATSVVAAVFAARYPERVVGVVMVGPVMVGPLAADGTFGWTAEAADGLREWLSAGGARVGHRTVDRHVGPGLRLALQRPPRSQSGALLGLAAVRGTADGAEAGAGRARRVRARARAHPGPALRRPGDLPGRGGTGGRGGDRRRDLLRASRGGTGRFVRDDVGLRRPACRGAGPRRRGADRHGRPSARDGAVHRHRRLDEPRRRDG